MANENQELYGCNDYIASESCNKALKYGSYPIHSNIDFDAMCRRVLNGANSRIQQHKNDAEREMLIYNYSLCRKPKDFLIKKEQGLFHCEHDRRRCKCVQLNSTEWYVWCFDDEYDLNERNQWPWNELPKFKRVQKLSATTLHSRYFQHCNSCFHERVGCCKISIT